MNAGNKRYTGSRFWLTACTLVFGLGLLVAMAPDFTGGQKPTGLTPDDNPVIRKDSAASVKAFASVYKVLMSPRCMNCHPSGDVPLQGDDSHLHVMQPTRGKDGKGIYAMKCANCHQPTNIPGLHTPPGNPNWHLPPADMKMVFQGKTPRQLARQLVDPKQNGHKDLQKLLEHVNDTLVIAGWHPGEGRTTPPLPYAEFKKAWITWIENGAYAPKK
jgi:mono/diheme cytochrome c family protein